MPHTILLVDDDAGLLAMSAMMLEDCGCEVLTAKSVSVRCRYASSRVAVAFTASCSHPDDTP